MITEIISKLKQGFEELEKGEVEKSRKLFEEILQKDKKNGQAYAGLLLIEKGLSKLSDLETLDSPFDSSENYKNAVLYGGKDLKAALDHCLTRINKRNAKLAREQEEKRIEEEKPKAFEEEKRKEAELKNQKSSWQKNAEKEQEILASNLRNETQKKKKNKKIFVFALAFLLSFSSISVLLFLSSGEKKQRKEAENFLKEGNYVEAYKIFQDLEDTEKIKNIKDNSENYALSLANIGKHEEAVELLSLTDKTTSYVFDACKSVLQGDYKKAVALGLTSLTLPNGISTVYDEAFFDCTALERIVIPEGVTKIGAFAFEGCSSLKEVVLPSSMKTIGENAFLGCIALKEISIPKNVTTIGRNAFYKCTLSKVVFEDENNWRVHGEQYLFSNESKTANDISQKYAGTWEKSR